MIKEPIVDFALVIEYELCVVSHEYLLNGKPFTLEVGLRGRIREQVDPVLPLVGQLWQLKPASHRLLELHVSPIWRLRTKDDDKQKAVIMRRKKRLVKRSKPSIFAERERDGCKGFFFKREEERLMMIFN